MIPGLSCASRASDLKSVSYITLGSLPSTSDNEIEIPGDAEAGDLCVLVDLNFSDDHGAGEGTLAIPSGFTLIGSTGARSTRLAVSAKVLDGTETSLVLMDEYEFSAASVWIFRGNKKLRGFTVHNGTVTHTSGNPTPITLDASGVSRRVSLALGFLRNLTDNGSANSIDSQTTDPAMTEVEASVNRRTLMFYKLYSSWAPVSHSLDMGDEGDDNYMAGCFLSFY